MRKEFLFFIVFILLVILVGCKDKEKSIKISEEQLVVYVNGEFNISIVSNEINNNDIIFECSEDNYVENIEEFNFKALKTGHITITFYYKDDIAISDSILIIIEEVKTIEFTNEQITVMVDEVFELPIIINGIDVDDIGLRLSKDNVIDVIDSMKIKALEEGEVTITAYYLYNEEVTKTITVIVEEKKDISFTSEEITLKIDEILDIPIELEGIAEIDVRYEFSKIDYISLLDLNKIKALKVGEVTLTAYYIFNEKIYSTINIVIEEVKIIEFSVSNISLKVNETIKLPLQYSGFDYLYDINYEVNIDNLISIELDEVTALHIGEVILTAYCKTDRTIKDTILIKIEPIYTVNDYQYWINQYDGNAADIILSKDDINDYNNNIINNYHVTNVVDLLNQQEILSGSIVKSLVEKYNNINSYTVYNDDNTIITYVEKNEILDNRNLNTISTNVNIKYGIVTEFSPLRSYPTLFYSRDYSHDMFQETGLNLGEGVLIYHVSKDGKWFFVQAQNYIGWIEASNVGLCTKDTLASFMNPSNFLVITADKIMIKKKVIRMGQTLPYSEKDDTYYNVKFPVRNIDGNLEIKKVNISNTEDVNDGYLDYTIENVYVQAFKMLGITYSWGDKFIEGRDCSSTQNSIYSCFGFKMPRNTSNQRQIPIYSNKVNSIDSFTLRQTLNPGALIFSSGHVLMYIGEDNDGNSYVFHNTSSGIPGCKVQKFDTYTGTIIATLKLY